MTVLIMWNRWRKLLEAAFVTFASLYFSSTHFSSITSKNSLVRNSRPRYRGSGC